MAKLNDLAGLAALGALGYMLNKSGSSDTSSDQAPGPGRQSLGAGYDSPGTNTGTADTTPVRKITDYMATAPSDSDVPPVRESGSEAPQATDEVISAPVVRKTISGTNLPSKAAPVKQNVNPTPTDFGALVNPYQQKKIETKPAAVKPAAVKPVAVKPAVKTDYYRGSDGKMYPKTPEPGNVPTSEEAAANRQAAYDKVKNFGSSVADYFGNFETPAERRSRLAKEANNKPAATPSRAKTSQDEDIPYLGSAMKRGGAVKKMAKGGLTSKPSTASSRGDGIASRGKTRGKLY